MILASVLLHYNGAITVTDIKKMSDRELMGYIDAANKLNGEETKEKGLSGQDALRAMKLDPAIKVM